MIILGGGVLNENDLNVALRHSSRVLAADGGANAAYDNDLIPEAVIGDMDSIRPDVMANAAPSSVHHIAEQDSTDFDKALRHVQSPCVLAVGFSGGRMDHQMGVLHTMVVRAHQPCLLLAAEDVVFLCPPRISLDLAVGTRVSLFPMGPVTGRSTGLEWPIDGLSFAPGLRSGTSNRAVGRVTLEMDAPLMLCFLPRDCLDLALKALVALPPGPAQWSVRAERYKDRLPS